MNSPKKKLIEVALPLDAINKACANEKSIRHGHPSTLHLWWARRPLAAARAMIFSQLVDDPSAHPDRFPTPKAQSKERKRLFKLIEDLVQWENTSNETVLKAAREEIWQSWRSACADFVDHPQAKVLFRRNHLPPFHDPFAGGGAIPLEAQRLGLEAHASDLNPVAVLLNKAAIEVPGKFHGKQPVHPALAGEQAVSDVAWTGARGLAEDVRFYTKWIASEAEKRLRRFYPPVEVTPAMAKERPDLKPLVGRSFPVVAWMWARTVRSPNPALEQAEIPLLSSFLISKKPGNEAYVEAVLLPRNKYRFTVRLGAPENKEAANIGTRAGKAQDFVCLFSKVSVPRAYIREEGKAGRIGQRLMAVIAEGPAGRLYLPPTAEQEEAAEAAANHAVVSEARGGFLSGATPTRAMITGGVCSAYGLVTWGHLFTDRQTLALCTFSDLVGEARERVRADALRAGMTADDVGLEDGGSGATAYADAVAVYLGLSSDRLADRNSSLCGWDLAQGARGREATVRNVFARQAMPMVWDFAEVNILGEAAGSFDSAARAVTRVVERLEGAAPGEARQADATIDFIPGCIVSTDPPYYDNISYAELSEFFYVWLRRSLKPVLPKLFSTLAVPKQGELIATASRHGSKERAESFFLDGMTRALAGLAAHAHPAYPVSIYYAFKQAETDGEAGTASTGWDTFLGAVIKAGYAISGTWPVRTELSNRMVSSGANALASSIVLVCRKRPESAPVATRREFVAALRKELPQAISELQAGNIAPVDLAQAAIGPGMAVFTRYSKVLDMEGNPMSVREALAAVNEALDQVLSDQEGDFDGDTRWALAWFDQMGFDDAQYGVAETLATAKNTSVAGLVEAGIILSSRGRVRLLRPNELKPEWNPAKDDRATAWEAVHYLVRAMDEGGEQAAAQLVAQLGDGADVARELAYRLFVLCERRKRASDAAAYNGLVQSWPEVSRLAKASAESGVARQASLFDGGSN